MTPKEKAIELVDKYSIKVKVSFSEDSIPRIVNAEMRLESAKQCALIAVDEVLDVIIDNSDLDGHDFWINVKYEIEKL